MDNVRRELIEIKKMSILVKYRMVYKMNRMKGKLYETSKNFHFIRFNGIYNKWM